MTKKFIVEYTNKDIMDKLEEITQKLDYTNGTVKTHNKLLYASFSFSILILSFVVYCLV